MAVVIAAADGHDGDDGDDDEVWSDLCGRLVA